MMKLRSGTSIRSGYRGLRPEEGGFMESMELGVVAQDGRFVQEEGREAADGVSVSGASSVCSSCCGCLSWCRAIWLFIALCFVCVVIALGWLRLILHRKFI